MLLFLGEKSIRLLINLTISFLIWNIGADVNSSFAVQRSFEPKGPLVNSEFYPGWLDYWGQPHNKVQQLPTILCALKRALKSTIPMRFLYSYDPLDGYFNMMQLSLLVERL